MWIVSQSKDLIINADTMQGVTHIDCTITAWHGDKIHNTLGLYTTEEKAKNVMKQLIEWKQGFIRFNGDRSEEPVFIMPQDNEVVI